MTDEITRLQQRLRKKQIEFKRAKQEFEQLKSEYEVKKPDNKLRTDVRGRPLDCELYMDGYLKSNLQGLYEFVRNDWDGIGFVTGYEGDGKTVLGMQMAHYLDADFNLENVVFTAGQFEERVDEADPFTAIVWDEADDLSKGWWDDMLQALISKFKRIRSKNLFIILITPTIFDLQKYFVIHRTRFLIEVYSDGTIRGFFKFFNRERKKDLYIKGKRHWDMDAASSNFKGRFTKLPEGFPIDWDSYNEKKDEATEAMLALQGQNKQQVVVKYRRDCVKRLYDLLERKGLDWNQQDIAEVFGVDRTTVSKDKSKLRIE